MRHGWVCGALPLVFVLALAVPLHGQSFGFAWWKDTQFQHDLGLSAEQSARIDAIFQAAISQLRPKKEELDKQEELLSQQNLSPMIEQATGGFDTWSARRSISRPSI
jgi:hypothetical protein